MAGPLFVDRTTERTQSSGVLTTIDLVGTITGFKPFLQAGVIEIGDTFHILVKHINALLGEWQVCEGTLTGATEITVGAIFSSSNNNAAVNFTVGYKYVILDADASLLTEMLYGTIATSRLPIIPASKGGLGADFSAGGGAGFVVKQAAGGAFSSAALLASEIPNLAASKITSGTFANSLINWASPSAIGTGTPAAGTFTALAGTTGAFSNTITGKDGTSGSLSYNFAGASNTGMYRSTSGIEFVVAGTAAGRWFGSGFVVYGPYQGARLILGDNLDVRIYPDAANAAAMLNATNAQRWSVYKTFTSATNYERAEMGWQTTADVFTIETTKGSGGGTVRPIAIIAPLTSVTTSDTATNTVPNVLTVNHASSGTAVAGFGAAILSTLKSSTTASRSASLIRTRWNVATDAAAIADHEFIAYYNAAGILTERIGFTVRGGASSVQTSVNGVTPVTPPTYGAVSGTLNRAAFNSGTATAAEVAQAVAALITDLKAFGIAL